MSDSSKNDCPFCTVATARVIDSNDQAFVIEDAYPVSRGHTLIVSRRHVESFFDLTAQEVAKMVTLLHRANVWLDERYRPSGYNIGINIGADAGQTVLHVHLHLIPRYAGDVAVAEGGVRNVIPGHGNYKFVK